MNKFSSSFTACAAFILLGVGVTPLANAGYVFTDLGSWNWYSFATGINNTGQVVGQDTTGRAALWDGTTTTDLGTLNLGGTSSKALAINQAGQAVGYSVNASNTALHATLWNGSTAPIDIGILSGNWSWATAINDNGQVAGYSAATGSGATQATLWNGTIATDLGTLGGSESTS